MFWDGSILSAINRLLHTWRRRTCEPHWKSAKAPLTPNAVAHVGNVVLRERSPIVAGEGFKDNLIGVSRSRAMAVEAAAVSRKRRLVRPTALGVEALKLHSILSLTYCERPET